MIPLISRTIWVLIARVPGIRELLHLFYAQRRYSSTAVLLAHMRIWCGVYFFKLPYAWHVP